MNTQERQYLFREKRAEGKNEMESNKEILDLIHAQKLFKKMKNEMKSLVTEIKKLEAKNEKLNNKIKEKKSQEFLKNLGQGEERIKEIKNGNHKVPTIHHVNRILNFTEVGKGYTKSDLAVELRIPSTLVEVALNFINRTTTSKFEKNDCKWIRK
jgi:hypothetical protein